MKITSKQTIIIEMSVDDATAIFGELKELQKLDKIDSPSGLQQMINFLAPELDFPDV